MPRWSLRLPSPIAVLDGPVIRTLKDGADYAQSIGNRVNRNAWQSAVRKMIAAAEGDGDLEAVRDQLMLALMVDGKMDFARSA